MSDSRHRERANIAAAHYVEMKAGNVDAGGKIYVMYKTEMFAAAFDIVKNSEDAQDIVQDTFYRLIRYGSYNPGIAQFNTYLYAIMTHQSIFVLDKREAEKIKKRGYLVRLGARACEMGHTESNVNIMIEIIKTLPPKYRAALEMYVLLNRSYKDIAETMGISYRAVANVIFKARKRFRVLYETERYMF